MFNEKKVLIIVFVSLVIMALGVSYAYFTASISGSESSTTVTVAGGTMGIVYSSGKTITVANVTPGWSDIKAFTVTGNNTTSANMSYNVYLIIETNTFADDAIAYSLTGTNTGLNGTLIPNIASTNLKTGASTTNLGIGTFIGSVTNKAHNYTLTISFINKDTNQNSDQGKSLTGYISVEAHKAPLDTSGANEPLLATNMIPVYYDNTNDVWKKADSNNVNATYKWYDYNAQMWANAVTVTSSTRSTYNSAAVGTQIPMADIMGMWVWIPRYEYMTTNLGTQYAGGTQALPGGISIKFISGTSTTNTTNYIIHPAFRNGTVYKYSADYDLGGWDKELTGFWMGKFETGYATNFTTTTGAISSSILVKPDVYSMRYQVVSNQYTTAASIQSDHGIGSTVETHMLKNDEWGAVAYLSQSAYGKYGNSDYTGANKEIYVNNAYYSTGPIYTTGRSNGVYGGGTGSGSTQYGTYEYNNCPASAYTHTSCTESTRNTNNTKGTGASTTGNIYGVYDMSGGAYEYVMANLSGTISSSGFSSMPNQKYWNKYTSTTLASACNGSPCYGQAITETGTGANGGYFQWYNDYMGFVTSAYPWAYRGYFADFAGNAYAGAFRFNYDSGEAGNNVGFRASIS
jgi:hypothetical protein